MTLGTILGAAFQTLRRNPAATLAPALLLTVVVGVIQAIGSAGFLTQYVGAITDATSTDSPSLSGDPLSSGLVSGFLGLFATSLVSGVLTLIVTAIIEGIVTVQVAGSTLGSRLRLGTLWGRLAGRRLALIGWAFLVGAIVIVALVLVGGLLVLLASSGGGGVVAAVLFGFLLGAGLFVVFVWLWVKLGFVPAAIVLERTTIAASVRRSWTLTRGAFWRVFGIRLLVAAMIGVATQIIVTPISFAFTLGGSLLAPNGTTDAGAANAVVISLVATQAVTAVISAVGLVISTATNALLYLDQRMRREGLDLELARFVEHREAGVQDLRDPYLPPETGFGAA